MRHGGAMRLNIGMFLQNKQNYKDEVIFKVCSSAIQN